MTSNASPASVRRRLGAAALMLSMAVATTATRVAEATTEPVSSVAAQPTRGGRAVAVMSGLNPILDPQLQRVSLAFTEAAVMAAIFGHLAYMDTETGAVELYFLESLEPNDDASVWTMTLHPGIRFSDGTPLDAEAIKYNMDRAADPATGSRFEAATEGLVVEVVDELTVQVTLPGPDPLWAADLVANFAGVGSPTAMQAAIDDGVEVGTRPVGAGPFMVKEWDPGVSIVLERNPYFEDFMPGQPYLDELEFQNVDDFSQQVTAIQTGAAQIVGTSGGGPTDELLATANAVPTYTAGGASIFLNTTIPPFDDIRARQALALAIDRQILSDAFAPGTAPSTTLFPETSPFHNPEYSWPEQDHDAAQQLFDELAAEGKPVEFSYTTFASAQQTAVVDGLIAQLAEYDNVTFEPDIRTYAEYIAAPLAGEFQSLAWGVYFINPVPSLLDYFAPGGTLNSTGWENPEASEAMEQLATASTIEEQKAVWDVVQRALVEDMPAVWLGQGVLTLGYSDGIVIPRGINLGTLPLWAEVGYE
ncbi:ABC transporter substrate-binding protein [Desertimonas flava]|uniref:ABC transporter substrate-binding protein n=1 Tax=Desertimonas flava TaxID=2064846 RepID=UPI0013C4C9C1|nr:ABC transporter substrate-binding protein [Desertimonas flava]